MALGLWFYHHLMPPARRKKWKYNISQNGVALARPSGSVLTFGGNRPLFFTNSCESKSAAAGRTSAFCKQTSTKLTAELWAQCRDLKVRIYAFWHLHREFALVLLAGCHLPHVYIPVRAPMIADLANLMNTSAACLHSSYGCSPVSICSAHMPSA